VVAQQGRSATVCSYDLTPDSAEFGKDAGTGTFTVSAPDGCTWTAASSASWLVVTSGNEGSGSGTATSKGGVIAASGAVRPDFHNSLIKT
jgi:hypothetical protein